MGQNIKVDIEYVEKFYDALRQGKFTDPDKFAEYFIDHVMNIALCERYIAYTKLLKGLAGGILVASNSRYVNERDKILFSSVIRFCNMILDTDDFDQNRFYKDLKSTTYGELYGLGDRGACRAAIVII